MSHSFRMLPCVGALLLSAVCAGASPSFTAIKAPNYGALRCAQVAVTIEGKQQPLVPKLPPARTSSGEISAIERAQRIAERFDKLSTQQAGWWDNPQDLLTTDVVNGEVVVTWKGHSTHNGAADYLVTCDTALSKFWLCSPRTAAKVLISQIRNVFANDWAAGQLRGVLKDRIDAYRVQARSQKMNADAYQEKQDWVHAVQALKDAINLAPDFVQANEMLLELKDKFQATDDRTKELLARIPADLPGLTESEKFRIKAEGEQEAKQWDAAIADYDRAIKASPWCLSLHLLKCDACRDAQKTTDDAARKEDYRVGAVEAARMAKSLATGSTWGKKFLDDVIKDEVIE